MAVITLSEVKVFLGIAGTIKDTMITALIPEVEGDIIDYCNDDFLASDGVTEAWPAGMKLQASKMIGWQMSEISGGGGSIGMQSESQGGYSYTRAQSGAGEYPLSILSSLNKWKKSRLSFGSVQSQIRDRRGSSVARLANDDYYHNTGAYDTVNIVVDTNTSNGSEYDPPGW